MIRTLEEGLKFEWYFDPEIIAFYKILNNDKLWKFLCSLYRYKESKLKLYQMCAISGLSLKQTRYKLYKIRSCGIIKFHKTGNSKTSYYYIDKAKIRKYFFIYIETSKGDGKVRNEILGRILDEEVSEKD